jgi:hypothetical protein
MLNEDNCYCRDLNTSCLLQGYEIKFQKILTFTGSCTIIGLYLERKEILRMKKTKKWLVVVGVIVVTLALFLSCDNGGGASQPSQGDIDNLGIAMGSAFEPITVTGDEETLSLISTDGSVTITPGGTPQAPTFTITWNNYTDPATNVTINGTMTLSLSGDSSTLTVTMVGTLTVGNAPITTVAFNVTITVDLTATTDGTTISGTITIDGSEFDAAGFGIEEDEEFIF